MDYFRKKSADHFGFWLRGKLKKNYPHVKITSAFLASQFNLRSKTSNTISNETARKWLNGVALPSIHRFETIKNWLGSDANFLVTYEDLRINHQPKLTPSITKNIEFIQQLEKSNLFSNDQINFIKSIH